MKTYNFKTIIHYYVKKRLEYSMTFDIWQADLVLERVAVVRQNANNLYSV